MATTAAILVLSIINFGLVLAILGEFLRPSAPTLAPRVSTPHSTEPSSLLERAARFVRERPVKNVRCMLGAILFVDKV